MKKSLVAECEAYLGAGPPAHMDDYVPDSLTEMIIAHGAQEEPLDAELFEIGTLIAREPGDFEELQDPEIRSYMRKGKALVRAVIDAQRTRVVREALAAYLAPA
ncbi:MAG: hypothetical protein HOV80_29425, partial [Polyangiaceae bacterium]|nr:hypothetical protein [Polyangiaceae bacterium]